MADKKDAQNPVGSQKKQDLHDRTEWVGCGMPENLPAEKEREPSAEG